MLPYNAECRRLCAAIPGCRRWLSPAWTRRFRLSALLARGHRGRQLGGRIVLSALRGQFFECDGLGESRLRIARHRCNQGCPIKRAAADSVGSRTWTSWPAPLISPRVERVQENGCPSDPNAWAHRSCGQFCNANGRTWSCEDYFRNGTCGCYSSSACN
jgi:hypothetical protein